MEEVEVWKLLLTSPAVLPERYLHIWTDWTVSPWLTEVFCSLLLWGGAVLVRSWGWTMSSIVFLSPFWDTDTDPSSVSSLDHWGPIIWVGWLTDFLLLSTEEIRANQTSEQSQPEHLSSRDCKRFVFLTVWAEILIRAIRTVLLPIAGVGDVDTAAVVTPELVVWTMTSANCEHK